MNARLNVVRFSNEDVIATSERPAPDYCTLFGPHFLADGTFVDNVDGGITANGQPFYYNPDGTQDAFDGLSLQLPSSDGLVAGQYYYSDAGEWLLCPIQNHSH